MEYCLTTEALCKTYRQGKALHNVTMHVPKGAIYGFVGKNGAGKTTLIRLICGLQAPTAGGYTLYGVRNTDPSIHRVRRRMGAVVESPAIYLDLTAEDNLRLQARLLGLPSEEGIAPLLELVGLGETGERRPETFPWACVSGWGLPWPSVESRISWCWMSLSTAWTPRASLRCGSLF